jgi:hypothetical protein
LKCQISKGETKDKSDLESGAVHPNVPFFVGVSFCHSGIFFYL